MKLFDFSTRSREFIWSLIRQRSYLDKRHLSKGSIAIYEAEINFLKLHLMLNSYKTDEQMAGFWMRHHDKIGWLLPGKKSNSHNSMQNRFTVLKAEASRIMTQDFINPDSPNKMEIGINPDGRG